MINKKSKKFAVTLLLAALLLNMSSCALLWLFSDDEPEPEPLPEPIYVDPALKLDDDIYVADVDDVTPVEEGFKYDDGDTEMIITPIDEDKAEEEIAQAERVINGGSGSKKWTSVTDSKGKETIYIKQGEKTVKAKVEKKPESHGVEKAASKAAALVQKKSAYSPDKFDYDENYATYYLELADCILYYPAQLTKVKAYEDQTVQFSDTRSKATLKISYEKNPYTSMDEVEGFIENSENDTILAYGPAWYSAETKANGMTTYTYVGLGEKYIVTATFTYESGYGFVFDGLRSLIKCKFIEGGVWVSEQKDENYYDATSLFNYNFSTNIVSYYSKELRAILLYPEMFSVKGDVGRDFASFVDPLSGATIYFSALDSQLDMRSFYDDPDYTDVNAVNEYALVAENPDAGLYTYAYFGSNNVTAMVQYAPEYSWVYGSLLPEIKVVPAEDFSDSTEMQDIVYDDVGCRITIPLQFEEKGFYDNVATFEDANTGITLSVTFAEITSNEQKTNIFECFDVAATDDDLNVGDHHVSWMNNAGYNYGARGNYSTALLTIHAPNAPTVYSSTLPLIKVEFVSSMERVPTEEEVVAEKENPPETTAETTKAPETTKAETTKKPSTTTKAETTKAQTTKPTAKEEPKEVPLPIMNAGLGDLLTDEESPLIKMLMNVDANQITKGDINIFRLIGEEDDITDEEVDMIGDTVEELVRMGFKAYDDEEPYFKSYVFYGELNGRDYIIGFTFEYTDETFGYDEELNWVYYGPGSRAYMTILTYDIEVDPGDVYADYDLTGIMEDQSEPDFAFDYLYHTAHAQRVVVENLKRSGEFDEEYVFLVKKIAQVYDDRLDFDEWHYEEVEGGYNYTHMIICYGKYDSSGNFHEDGRYIYDKNYKPAEVDLEYNFDFETIDHNDRYAHIWDPSDAVDEIYDYWSDYAEIDNFFDALEAELDDYYDDYVRDLDIGGGFDAR